MRSFGLTIRGALCIAVILVAGCKPNAQSQASDQVVQASPPPLPTATPPPMTPTPTATPEKSRLEKLAEKVRPAVILVTVFDSTGKLLRSGTGFFVSDNGRIVTTSRTLDGALNAVAKTGDGGIYNISSIATSSSKLGIAVLNADAKNVPFLPFSEKGRPDTTAQGTVVGSALAGNEGGPIEAAISEPDPAGNEIALAAAVPEISLGAPLVDENGEVVGIVTERNKKDEKSSVARPASAVKTLVGELQPNTVAKWPGERPSPTPRPRLVYTPKPVYPAEARFSDGVARTGRYRVTFNVDGTAKTVQVMNSTGVETLDAAAVKGLGQWKCEPGRDGAFVIVPLTFQSR